MSKQIASETVNASINLGPLIGVKKFPVKFNIAAELEEVSKNSPAQTEPSALPIVKVSGNKTVGNRISSILSNKNNNPKNVVLKFSKQKKN
jgi:hypothetical protein